MAALADSLVQVGQRVDNLATDMSTQMQNMTEMLHTLMAHVGITPQLHVQIPAAISQPALQPTVNPEASVFEHGSRQLHRHGTGSRSPRRDHEEPTLDGIPDLPPSFSFDQFGNG